MKLPISLFLLGYIAATIVQAGPSIRIGGLKSPAWIQLGEEESSLAVDSDINFGNQIVTGRNGAVKLDIGDHITVFVNADSTISLLAEPADRRSDQTPASNLSLHDGRTCIQLEAPSDSNLWLRLSLGTSVVADLHLRGDICALRQGNMSSLRLRDGSVQIIHAVDPNLIILSRPGSEYHISDDGSYSLLTSADEASPVDEIEQPFPFSQAIERVTRVEPASASQDTPRPAVQAKSGVTTVYTVYLFSTRSREIAQQVNLKFRNAGHDSRIFERADGDETRYRIGVTDFATRQAAVDFAAAITGRLGVTGTWIGKNTE